MLFIMGMGMWFLSVCVSLVSGVLVMMIMFVLFLCIVCRFSFLRCVVWFFCMLLMLCSGCCKECMFVSCDVSLLVVIYLWYYVWIWFEIVMIEKC